MTLAERLAAFRETWCPSVWPAPYRGAFDADLDAIVRAVREDFAKRAATEGEAGDELVGCLSYSERKIVYRWLDARAREVERDG